MRRARPALAALLLGGCAGAVAPIEAETPPVSQAMAAEAPLPDAFAALVTHVEQRAALWREGAPINSLVLDSRQTVLNPVAIGCARREPLVIVDADPAPDARADGAADAAWRHALAKIRAANVGILWVTERFENETAALRPALPGAESADMIAGRKAADDRKQTIRQRWAASHCILAIIGDTRADADEAYAFLRDPATSLPIDSNWGAGWFLLPLASAATEAGQ